MSFMHLKVGDKVTRSLAGVVDMSMIVKEVTPELLVCDVDQEPSPITDGKYWTFDRLTGAEVDEELGWGPATGVTGSVLKESVQ